MVQSPLTAYRPRAATPTAAPAPVPKVKLFERLRQTGMRARAGAIMAWRILVGMAKTFAQAAKEGAVSVKQGVGHFAGEIKQGLAWLKQVFVLAKGKELSLDEIRIFYALGLTLIANVGLWTWLHFELMPATVFEVSNFVSLQILPLFIFGICVAYGRPIWLTITACFALAMMVNNIHQFVGYYMAAPWATLPMFFTLLASVGNWGVSFYTFQLRWHKRQAQWAEKHGETITVTDAFYKAKDWVLARRKQIKDKYKALRTQAHEKYINKRKQYAQWLKDKKKQAQKLPGQYQKSYTRFRAQLPGKITKQKTKWLALLKAKQTAMLKWKNNLPKVFQTYKKKFQGLIKSVAARIKTARGQIKTGFKNMISQSKNKIKTSYKNFVTLIKTAYKNAVAFVKAKTKAMLNSIKQAVRGTKQKMVNLPRLVKAKWTKAKGVVRGYFLKTKGLIKAKFSVARRWISNVPKVVRNQVKKWKDISTRNSKKWIQFTKQKRAQTVKLIKTKYPQYKKEGRAWILRQRIEIQKRFKEQLANWRTKIKAQVAQIK